MSYIHNFDSVGKSLLCLTLPLALGFALTVFGCARAASPDATLRQISEEVQRGQLDAALHDADAAFYRYQGKNAEWAARFRVQKAHILLFRGSYSECLKLLDEPLPPSLSRSDTEVQRKMVQGLAYPYLQQFDAADQAISEAENLAAAIQSTLLGNVAQSRGILEMDRENYAKAAMAYRTAAAFAKDHNLPGAELRALASLGNIAMWEEHYDEALDHFKKALERSRTLEAAVVEAETLGNIGWNYSVVGDLDAAEFNLKEAEERAVKANLVGDHVKWLNMLSIVYFQQHRYDIARVKSEEALALAREVKDNRDITSCLNTSSEIALATGRVDEAEKYNREALGIEKAGLDRFGVTSSTIIAGRIAASKKQYREAEEAFQKIIADRAVGKPLRWEAQANLAQVYAAQNLPVKAEEQFGLSISTISGAWGELQSEEFRLSFLSSAIRFYGAYVNFLIEQKRPLDALRIADLSRAQTLEHGLTLSRNGGGNGATGATAGDALKRAPTSGKANGPGQAGAFRPQETARRLNATLLFYWLGEQSSHLWVITPGKVSLLPLAGREEIDSAVRSYLSVFPGPRDPLEAGNADGKKLYTTLIAPVAGLIPKDSRVIILPDSELNTLNFETLIVPGDKPHYWVEDVTVLTGNSLALLARISTAGRPKDPSLFLMGDALQTSADFPALPQAGKEIGLVGAYFPANRRKVLTGAQATPSAYLSGKPEKYSYVHFSAHGTASSKRPLESAVILSPEGDAYKLYARDIVQHPLKAYLVTISACNGAGMRTYAGEGLVGLAWAFLRAGAHNVIGGLWEVSNASTPQLMDELYKGLNAGKDPATALRNAKLTLVHSTGNYRRPYYWGPFQLYAGS